jgi:hypothetical protein
LDYGGVQIDIFVYLYETTHGHLREEVKIIPDQRFFSGRLNVVNFYDRNSKIYIEYNKWDINLNEFLSKHLENLVDDLIVSMENRIRYDRTQRLMNMRELLNLIEYV